VAARWRRLDEWETALVEDSRWLPRRPPHLAVTAVTASGRGGASWLTWCAVEAVRPHGNRALAARAAASVCVALGAAQLVKRLVPPRSRPEPPGGPARRELPERPESSSFPSAHAATAAAVTTVVLAEDRRSVVLVAPVALVTVYGRLRTRVHWPSDVAAGAVLGVATSVVVRVAFRRAAPRFAARAPSWLFSVPGGGAGRGGDARFDAEGGVVGG
jgi:membrane-associated phospholipid phosphatase